MHQIVAARRRARHTATGPGNENRRVGTGIVAQRIRLILDILADDADKERPRELILDLGPQDATDVHERAVRTAIHLLPEIADRIAHALRGTVRQLRVHEDQVRRSPFEEILVVALEKEAIGAEMLPLRRRDLYDVFAIFDRRLPHEGNGVEAAPPAPPPPRALPTIWRAPRGAVSNRVAAVAHPPLPAAP